MLSLLQLDDLRSLRSLHQRQSVNIRPHLRSHHSPPPYFFYAINSTQLQSLSSSFLLRTSLHMNMTHVVQKKKKKKNMTHNKEILEFG